MFTVALTTAALLDDAAAGELLIELALEDELGVTTELELGVDDELETEEVMAEEELTCPPGGFAFSAPQAVSKIANRSGNHALLVLPG